MKTQGLAVMIYVVCSVAQSAGLPRSTPETQGVSSAEVLSFVEAVDEIDSMNSFMLVRHGHVVSEGWWTPYRAEARHSLYSLSKSFTSTAVGLAIAEDKLNLDDNVLKFFSAEAPPEPGNNLKAMRVSDLLRMSTGHQTEPPRKDDEPWARSFLHHPVPFKPGTHFLYNTPATYMQSAIVQKVTGETVLDYLRPRLFEPLGIDDPTWETSPQGISTGGFGLSIRTEDIARFGQLYGTFGPAISSPAGFSGKSIAVGDFDNDGYLDLAGVSLSTYPAVSVMFGNGNGNFVSPSYISLGRLATPMSEPVSVPMSVAVGDFNEDHLMDIAVTAAYNSHYGGYCCGGVETRVHVILAHDDRTFSAPEVAHQGGLSGPGVISPLVVTDFNGDDQQDALVGFDGEYVRILLGDGEGNLASANNSNWHIRQGSGMAVGDLNGDDIADLVAVDNANVNVRLGYGAGGFEPPPWSLSYTAGNGPRSAVLGDFNRDGNLDIATANSGSNDVSILRGRGDGTFSAPESIAVGTGDAAAAAADFNHDGVVDTADYVMWRKTGGTPDQYAAWRASFGKSVETVDPRPLSVTAGDFNGDGWLDIATANAFGNTATVLMNDQSWPSTLPAVSVGDATVTEGNTLTASATFTLTLSQAAAVDVTVDYATANITAAAGSDFTATSGTVVIPAGQTSRTFTIAVIGDRVPEPLETFAVYLSTPTNATIGDRQGFATVLDDEPQISITDVTRFEGRWNRTTPFIFTVTLSAAYDEPVTMSYRTVDGTATTSNNDYVSNTGTLSFVPGETTTTITIEVKGDYRREDDEYFNLDLFDNSGNSLISNFAGVGTILNDDLI